MNEDEMMTDPAAEGQEPAQAGYCIEVYVAPDGKISVDVEPADEEVAEGETEQRTPVGGLKQAIEMIMDIVKNNGQVGDAMGDEQFDAGFGPEKKRLAKKFP